MRRAFWPLSILVAGTLLLANSDSLSVFGITDFTGGMWQSNPSNNIAPKYGIEVTNISMDDNGTLRTRKASRRTIAQGFDAVALFNYKKSNGREYVIVQDSGTIYAIDFTTRTQLITGLSQIQPCDFTQHLDVLYWTNGVDPVGSWDGNVVSTISYAPKGKYIESHRGKLFIAGTFDSPAYLYFQETGVPVLSEDAWTNQSALNIDSNDGQIITGMTPFGGMLLVFKERSTFIVAGSDEVDFSVRVLSKVYGCVSDNAHGYWQNMVVWMCKDGIVGYDGSGLSIISRQVEPLTSNILATQGKRGRITYTSDTDFDSGTYQYMIASGGSLRIATQTVTMDSSATFTASGYVVDRTTVQSDGQVTITATSGAETKRTLYVSKDANDQGGPLSLGATGGYAAIDGNDYTRDLCDFYNHTVEGWFTYKSPEGFTWSRIRIGTRNWWYGAETDFLSSALAASMRVTIVTDQNETEVFSTDQPDSLIRYRVITHDPNTMGSTLNKIRFYGRKRNTLQSDNLYFNTPHRFDVFTVEAWEKNSPVYPSSGTYESPVFDGGGPQAQWESIKATYDASGGSSVTFLTATADNAGGPWDAWVRVDTTTWYVMSADKRYMKVRAELYTDKTDYSPSVNAIEVQYSSEAVGTHITKTSYVDVLGAWGYFYATSSGTAAFFFRSSDSVAAVEATPWTPISNGDILPGSTDAKYYQVKSSATGTDAYINGYTLDWYISGVRHKDVAMVNYKDRLYVAYSTYNTNNDTILVLDRRGAYGVHRHVTPVGVNGFVYFDNAAHAMDPVYGFYELDTADTDGTEAAYSSGDHDMGYPDVDKRCVYAAYTGAKSTSNWAWVDWYVNFATSPYSYVIYPGTSTASSATITASHYIDFSTSTYLRKTFPVLNAKNLRFRIRSTGTVELHKLNLYYELKDFRK